MSGDNLYDKLRDDVDYLVDTVDGNVREGKMGLVERADDMKESIGELEAREKRRDEDYEAFKKSLSWVFALPAFVRWAGIGGVVLLGGAVVDFLKGAL